MNLIKSITLMLLISVLTLKTVDLTFSFFFPQDNVIENGEKRQVVLREHNPGIRTSLTPDEDYLRYTETLDKKIYSLREMNVILRYRKLIPKNKKTDTKKSKKPIPKIFSDT